MNHTFSNDIINLNVGGTRFSTSRQTLCSIQDSFFSSLLSGRIPTCRDETGALFVDRDPDLFKKILSFLRTKELDLNGTDVSVLRHEAEFYGILPLVKRLMLCEDLDRSLCGDVLFTGFIPPPLPSAHAKFNPLKASNTNVNSNDSVGSGLGLLSGIGVSSKPGNVLRLNNTNTTNLYHSSSGLIIKNNYACNIQPSSQANADFQNNFSSNSIQQQSYTSNEIYHNSNSKHAHSRKSSNEISTTLNYLHSSNQNFSKCHSRNLSLELKQVKTDLGILITDSSLQQQHINLQANILVGHLNWISVAYNHFVCCYKLKDGMGWQLMFQSAHIDEEIERIALNSKHQPTVNTSNSSTSSSTSPSNLNFINTVSNGIASNNLISSLPNTNSPIQSLENSTSPKLCALLAISFKNSIRLWLISDETTTHLIGNFCLNSSVDSLFFIGSQLVGTSSIGKIGVWNSLSQLWQIQDITPINCFDTAGSFLLLGGQNGVLYYIDMQKFPLRMKDNDLLVTELYKDPLGDSITALSVYLTPKLGAGTGNWIEIAYGTNSGQVRVIVQHPETVGHGPQLFQSFSVHRGSVIKVMLTEKHLVSVCSEFNHVRTWNVTRFRGMISTQPGSTPLASFKIVTIDAIDSSVTYSSGNDIGPFGERDNGSCFFIQKVVPYTDQLFVRLSSTGKRICTIKSVDYSTITCYSVHECDGPSRLNSRPRRYLFTGHSNGTIQLWDLTTALELKPSDQMFQGGPSSSEFIKLLDQCDLISTNSVPATPTISCTSPCSTIINKINKYSSSFQTASTSHQNDDTEKKAD